MTSIDHSNPNPDNCCSLAPRPGDVSLNETVSKGLVAVGEVFSFTLTASGDELVDSSGCQLVDTLPAGLQFAGPASPLDAGAAAAAASGTSSG